MRESGYRGRDGSIIGDRTSDGVEREANCICNVHQTARVEGPEAGDGDPQWTLFSVRSGDVGVLPRVCAG